MNLSTMRTEVRTRIGNPSTDGFYSDAQLNSLINEAMHFISSADDWPWLQTSENITTVAGTRAYTPNANWVRTKQLYINDSEPFVFISVAEADDNGNRQGQPDQYTIYDEDIIMVPTPSSVYTVVHQYIKKETDLSGDSDSPIMPTMFHYAIVEKAAELALLRAGYGERASTARQQYQEWYRNMISFRRRSQVPMRPRVRPGSWL